MGYISFFENFVQIVVLLFAWIVVLLAFFILAIQLFVTLIEFKLTTLAGFVLIPFGLFGKTAFAAERVLGNVISSGIKVLVLAAIVGIGSTLFSQFTAGFGGNQPTIEDAMTLVLAALSLLGLGIFGPGIANGLVSGGPQLGAGAAVGTGLAAGGIVAAGAGLAIAMACDIRIAAESAFVTTGYLRVGLSGDYGIAWLLTRLVGTSRARELMFTGEKVDAKRAESIGLVNRVVPDAKLRDEAYALAKSIAEGPTIALRYMKDNLDEALAFDFATARDHEAVRLIRTAATADHREAVQAFVEKRKPVFTGN